MRVAVYQQIIDVGGNKSILRVCITLITDKHARYISFLGILLVASVSQA